MWDRLTPDLIASALVGLVFALSGLGIYSRTRAPKIEGAYRIDPADAGMTHQLERIAQALEDLVAAEKDSFQDDMRRRFEKLEEIMEHQPDRRGQHHRGSN